MFHMVLVRENGRTSERPIPALNDQSIYHGEESMNQANTQAHPRNLASLVDWNPALEADAMTRSSNVIAKGWTRKKGKDAPRYLYPTMASPPAICMMPETMNPM